MNDEERTVARHYDENIFEYELERLERHSPVEFGLTLRALSRWLPPGAEVAVEVGVGSGAYSSWLASRGIRVHLVDVSGSLLQAAADRLERQGLSDRIAGRHHLSATALRTLPNAHADVLLVLGPLYHLRDLDDRRRSVREAARVLKPGGMIFAAGVNRLALLRDAFRDAPDSGERFRDRRLRFLDDGRVDPDTAPPIGFAHLTTVAEFIGLFADEFNQIALWGLESFTSPAQEKLG
ncbi:MAG TPA: class I SAM-dependent methyltransferase, partial [Blastocatellia bacterium]|nr:class I SAM-dependent methyltransferase [Blastocatellia bacterium]